MKLEWTKKDVEVTKNMSAILERKMEKIGKFVSEDTKVKVSYIRNGGNEAQSNYQLEVFVPFRKSYLKVVSRNTDYYEAVDEVVNTLVKKIKKEAEATLKTKRKQRKGNLVPNYLFDEAKSNKFSKVSRKELELKPMFEEEALLQMEMFNLDYFLFRTNSDDVQMIRKQKNGKFEIISVL